MTQKNNNKEDWPDALEHKEAICDIRNISTGWVIPAQSYADQPYVVKTHDGSWLCVLTTGLKEEGSHGQHIISMRSGDRGKTWTDQVAIESPFGPEASWAVPYIDSKGRIYVFYVYNADNIRSLPAEKSAYPSGQATRMDSHGYYVFRWSDDHGRTWSPERVEIPVREFAIDRNNSTQGSVRLFWNVGRPVCIDESFYLPLHKVAGLGVGWFTRSEGALVMSADILSLENPAESTWVTLPEGEVGLQAPPGGGPIAEEQCLLTLSDGTFLSIYRSIDGYPVEAYSRDAGKHWETPKYLRYANGRRVKHPRAACFSWKLVDGEYLLWFHNHGGRHIGDHPNRAALGYADRNPAWIARGFEIETDRGLEVVWENPEILLYDDDPQIRMSYPDMIETEDALYFTETQKEIARVHRVDDKLARVLRHGTAALDIDELNDEVIFKWQHDSSSTATPHVTLPRLIARSPHGCLATSDLRGGYTFIIKRLNTTKFSGELLSVRSLDGFGGFRLTRNEDTTLTATLSDGRTSIEWSSDPLNDDVQHIALVVDGGPKILAFYLDGWLCDGGESRQFGYGRYSSYFRGVEVPLSAMKVCDGIESVEIYDRALLSMEIQLHHQSHLAPPLLCKST